MDETGGIRFINSIKDIDSWIRNEDMGMSMMLSDLQKKEMALRRKQLIAQRNGTDEYEDDGFIEMMEEHAEMTKEVKQKNSATHKNDIPFRPLKPALRQQLELDMMTSYVRADPESEYNKTDAELYGENERGEIRQKLLRVRNIYFTVIEWREAMKIVIEAIKDSLKHDYPWMSQEDTFQAWKEGRIRYKGNIPKLYLGYGTNQITDPQILMGILQGDVDVIDRDEEDKRLRRQHQRERVEYTPVRMDYDVIGHDEYRNCVKLHNMGYDTPISSILKANSKLFDRLTIPFSFSISTETDSKKNEELFDWSQPNAGEIFYCQQNGINRYTRDTIMDKLSESNPEGLAPHISTDIQSFMHSFANPNEQYVPVQSPKPLEPSSQAQAMEQALLDSLRKNNPNL